jgi:hypothetical protein
VIVSTVLLCSTLTVAPARAGQQSTSPNNAQMNQQDQTNGGSTQSGQESAAPESTSPDKTRRKKRNQTGMEATTAD